MWGFHMRRENPGGDALGSLLMLGGIGALAYYGYSQGWFSAFLGTAAAATPTVGTNLATGQPAATGTQTGSPAVPTWAGPSLDQMYTALLAAEQAAMSASVPDPALTCLVVPGSTTSNAVNTTPITSGSIATNPNAARTATGQALSTPTYTQSALSGLGAVSCAMPLATYDVHNWYLANRANSGIAAGPEPPDHTTVVSLADYWTWAAPLLKAANPGLAGGFGRGLGAYAELGRLMQMQRGY